MVVGASRGDEQKLVVARVVSAGEAQKKLAAAAATPQEAESPSDANAPTTLLGELSESRGALFVGPVPAVRVMSEWCQWRTVFIMGMVLFAFGRQVWGAAKELRHMTNMMGKLDAEAEAIAAASGAGSDAPMSPRAFAAANGLAPAAGVNAAAAALPSAERRRTAQPAAVAAHSRSCEASRRTSSEPASRRRSEAPAAAAVIGVDRRALAAGGLRRARSSTGRSA